MKQRLVPLMIVLVVVLAAAGYFVQKQAAAKPDRLRLSGNIETTEVDVSFRIPGVLKSRNVDEGSLVRAGQLVATLDDADMQHQLALRQAELEAAKQQLLQFERGYRKEEIQQARAALDSAKAEAARANADAKRVAELFRQEVISARDNDLASSTAIAAAARVREAEQALELLSRGYRTEQTEGARANLDRASEAVAAAQLNLQYATIVSPTDGVVLTKSAEPGEHTAAGMPVVTIGDMQHVWLRTYVDESDAGKIKPGQHVEVTTDSFPSRKFDGVVAFISSESEFTPKTVQTDKERVKLVYRVKINIANPSLDLKPGMPADAWIPLAKD